MSRSYKKTPKLAVAEDKAYKKIFNRRIRRNHLADNLSDGGAYKKLNDPWDICDYKEYRSWRAFKKDNLNKYQNEQEAFLQWQKWYRRK